MRLSYHIVGLVTLSVIITLLTGEGLLRIYRWAKIGFSTKHVALQGDEAKVLFRYDRQLGWLGKNNFSGELMADEFRIKVNNNQWGFRERDLGAKTGKRIVVLGDSSVWGYGIEAEQRMTNVVEGALGVEVLNLGIVGFGTDQKYLTYREYGRKLAADVVVIVIDNNDFSENTRSASYDHYKPFFRVKEGRLRLYNYPVPADPEKSWWENWRLWQILKPKWQQLTARSVVSSDSQDSRELTLVLIRQLIKEVALDGSRPMVLFLPTRCELANQKLASEADCFSEDRNMAQLALGKEKVIDVFSAFASESARLYFTKDPHINSTGNAVLAKLVIDYLEQK